MRRLSRCFKPYSSDGLHRRFMGLLHCFFEALLIAIEANCTNYCLRGFRSLALYRHQTGAGNLRLKNGTGGISSFKHLIFSRLSLWTMQKCSLMLHAEKFFLHLLLVVTYITQINAAFLFMGHYRYDYAIARVVPPSFKNLSFYHSSLWEK